VTDRADFGAATGAAAAVEPSSVLERAQASKPLVAGLVVASEVPALLRAATALGRRRLNGDVLEASTLLLLTARRHYAASALLTWLRVAGEYVVARTAVTARRSLHEVISPPDAVVPRVEDGRTRPVRVPTLGIGDIIIVGAGERLPIDGTVVRGEALVNQQTMTGEALRLAGFAANADLQVLTQQAVWEIDVLPRALSVVVGNGMALTLPVDAEQ
jgi:cation transport ATPase